MKLEEEIKQKLDEAIDILSKFGMPPEQQNERTAYCLFSPYAHKQRAPRIFPRSAAGSAPPGGSFWVESRFFSLAVS